MAKISFPDGECEFDTGTSLPAIKWECGISIDGKTKSGAALPRKGGLLRIRWRPDVSRESFPRNAMIKVAYGYNAEHSKELKIISYPDDVLYIGKAQDIRERAFRIFSRKRSSNSTARKIAALIKNAEYSALGHQEEDISDEELVLAKSEIVLDFMEISEPLLRDFMKAYAVSSEKPCLNIGLEH